MNNNFNNYIPSDTEVVGQFPVLAKVVGNLDPTYMGTLQVQLLRDVGNDDFTGQTYPVKMLSPFWGQTPLDANNQEAGFNNTQKSYGMWMVPPDVGSIGIVIFVNGNIKRGFWLGFVPEEYTNFMVPGLAATEFTEERELREDTGDIKRVPTAEYNKTTYKAGSSRGPAEAAKPKHPIADALADQGLLFDDIRGITSSSARRDIPSMVFGISSPGPLDRKSDAPSFRVGTQDSGAVQFSSRLGGTSVVMDDGDSAFLRKGPAQTSGPDYAAVEQGDATPEDPNIPHNELFRIRTRTGHQILLHNSEDLIYISNAKGTAWIEFTSNGKIDIFSQDSISIHSSKDLNLRADRDINLEAGRNYNLHVVENKEELVRGNNDIIVLKDNKITTLQNLHLGTQGITHLTSNQRIDILSNQLVGTAGRIYWNSRTRAVAATGATPLTFHEIPDSTGETAFQSIMKRVPMHEPWPHHENLKPTAFTPENTDREIATKIETPESFLKYTTSIDTFRRDPPAT